MTLLELIQRTTLDARRMRILDLDWQVDAWNLETDNSLSITLSRLEPMKPGVPWWRTNPPPTLARETFSRSPRGNAILITMTVGLPSDADATPYFPDITASEMATPPTDPSPEADPGPSDDRP